ncbi:GalNAc-alpha-(1-_4)-GalNAc-alpha-(1-_3)-diNAcBac-PP-undecaprenol alpha-1,4-N-acetyl-D-galactosaminyltransferase [Defluviimonas aquaemixtae]|uniref:GalNAc-alpha-(1->4)-GalNAc-alpha-(1->3)-diNAcBac-PP-undecaprenol alpha-1,4-N-acetyl-D-galactosaminyltransferase n=1 Tax=Albidovulum aquaemixtae TaxID=1542388 RepID=A0A2R8B2T2_9RHOB|nr:glycosyltransferase [Defluviimonas aquaemixtae]SPH16885.1 GalNAc-alpha-(1->4)-GalNAc-alpha-(1->3)-diNAcBac-PP-undecaprenol alpha-1,4-N-acetyl-D-galactosaminyltransferase [Defluviimonas aquaemixtae]
MKVVFVIQKLAGLRGGAERVTIDTARALSQRGFEVSIVCFEPGRGAPAYDAGPVRVENLFPAGRADRPKPSLGPSSAPSKRRAERFLKAVPNGLGLGHLKWALTHGFFVRRLRRMIETNRPDVIVAAMRPAITAAAFAARGTTTKVVAVLHNVPSADYDDATRWDQNPVYRRRSLEAFDYCDRILVLLEEFREWFPPAARERVEVLPNAVSRLSPPDVTLQRSRIILSVGRLTAIKRIDLLIEAWARIAARHPDWRVVICGTGPEEQRLRAIIDRVGLHDQVTMQGDCPETGAYYDIASILCHPAAHEGFGLAVAEALVHGVAAIGFADCPGVNTLLRDGDNGLLVQPSDEPVVALSEALERLVSDSELRCRLSRRGPDSMADYAPARIYARWEALLRELGRCDKND